MVVRLGRDHVQPAVINVQRADEKKSTLSKTIKRVLGKFALLRADAKRLPSLLFHGL